ncbi:MAG TPA: hypothetical protein VJU77_18990 [Chthoniobacterales bacterium]|nr:hypothetical protein [Chthoniobacterales bacterium]
MKTHEVFGIAATVRPVSYIDRGELDAEFGTYLNRDSHIALRGESKCGKSWLRQNAIPDALVVQCRLSKSVRDVYIDALSQLDIQLVVSAESSSAIKGKLTAKGEFGVKLLAKVGLGAELGGASNEATTSQQVGHDINDLRFVADLIRESGRRLVIEDFHYMTIAARREFAFDLKALWDYRLFVVIVGVWSQSNMLLHLNPDLSGRVHEIAVEWNRPDLRRILDKGGRALGINFSPRIQEQLASLSFANAGILQQLTLKTLDAAGITDGFFITKEFDDAASLEQAALEYAELLNPLYQQFAANVSGGIRTRKNSTGIYAHAIAVIMDASDSDLLNGLSLQDIFKVAHARQHRIQSGNLKTVLEKIEELQVDEDGRGMVLSYNQSTERVYIVDKQLLLYRRFSTVHWPWDNLIAEAGDKDAAYAGG